MQYPLVNCDRLISAITQLRRLLRLIQERKKWRLEYIRTVIVQKCVRQKPTVAHDAICLRLFDNSAKLKNFIILFIFIIFGTTYLLSSRNLKKISMFQNLRLRKLRLHAVTVTEKVLQLIFCLPFLRNF